MMITYKCECGNTFKKLLHKAETYAECPVCKKKAVRTFSAASFGEPDTVASAIDEVVFGQKKNCV